MSDSAWKAVERRVCGRLRLSRNPGSGSNGGSGCRGDCLPPGDGKPRNWLYVEIKHFAAVRLPGLALWKDTETKAKAEGRRPVVVYHEKGTQRYLAVIELGEFAALLDKADANGTI